MSGRRAPGKPDYRELNLGFDGVKTGHQQNDKSHHGVNATNLLLPDTLTHTFNDFTGFPEA